MQRAERTQRNWLVAFAASIAIHALMLGFVRFTPVPPADVADDATPVAIIRISKRVSDARGRRGGVAAAPHTSRTKPDRRAAPLAVARGAMARGSVDQTTTGAARLPDARVAESRSHSAASARSGANGAVPATVPGTNGPPATMAGTEESPGPAPTITAEMLASLNQRMHDAIPSAAPQTIARYSTDLGTLAMRPDPNRWTVANYPLPQKGLFAHAIIVRVGREAVAVRAIQRIGNAYICIGYLAKVDEHDPQATLAGPYIGPCKKAWREQLGLAPKPSPSPAADPSGAPSLPSPGPFERT